MRRVLPVFLLFLSIHLPASGAEECHIVYGMIDSFRPYEWLDDSGEPTGLAIELVKLIAKESGCSYEFVVDSYPGLVEKIRKKEITMKWHSRLLEFDDYETEFTMPLVALDVSSRRFFSRKGSEHIDRMDDIYGKTVVVMEGATSHLYAESLRDNYNLSILTFSSVTDALTALSSGTGDFAFFSTRIMDSIIPAGDYNNIRMSGQPIMPAMFELVLHKSDINLFIKLDQAVQNLKMKGEYYTIVNKWFNKEPDYTRLYKTAALITAAIAVLILLILLWNRFLRYQIIKNTERINRINAENMKLKEEAIIVGRLAALGEMATSVAHEINNPAGLIMHNMAFLQKLIDELLTYTGKNADSGIKFCSMLLREVKNEAGISTEIINNSLERIASTVNELKKFGKVQPESRQEIDLRDCIDTAARLTSYFTKKYTEHFEIQLSHRPVIIIGNAMHVEECIINLIQNACYALKSNDGFIRCTAGSDGEYATITIEDNGGGMSEDTLRKACEAFFTTRPDSGGTGLGLAIVSRIMKEHKGYLEIKSEINIGTSVTLFFPRLK